MFGNNYNFPYQPLIASDHKIRKFKTVCIPADPNREKFTIRNCVDFIPHDNYITIVTANSKSVNLVIQHYFKIEVIYDEKIKYANV